MKAPAGAIVGLYVDLRQKVKLDDIIETSTGRRYRIVDCWTQVGGKKVGRQHLRALVLEDGAEIPPTSAVHRIRWYSRNRRERERVPKGVARVRPLR